MRLFVVADIEGIAGVMRLEQCRSGESEYELARILMEKEVNAAISGAFEGGASRVVVADSHATMCNLRSAHMHPDAELIQGKPRAHSMAEGLADQPFDAVAFIGFHSAAGEPGVLAHTINGRAFQRIELNTKLVGETDLFAAYAGELGIPLCFVSGDDQLTSWVEKFYPHTYRVCVKRMISTQSAQSLSSRKAQEIVRKGMQDAVTAYKCSPPHTLRPRFQPPFHVVVTTTHPVIADALAMFPGIVKVQAQQVTYNAERMSNVITTLNALSLTAQSIT